MTFAKLAPVCSASGDRLNSYGNATRKDGDGRAPCPVCGKPVKLRKAGLDRHPNTIPHHHDERGYSRGRGSSYPQFPGRKLGKPATVVSTPVAVENRDGLRTLLAELPGMHEDETKGDAVFRCGINGALNVVEGRIRELLRSAPVAGEAQHPDDIAVDKFAAAMKAKLAKKRDEGRYGWQSTSHLTLSSMLYEHMYKGDPLDVGNLAMMLHQNRKTIELPEHARRKDVAPQASADAGITASGHVRNAALEEAAAALEDHRKAGREWVPGSLWDTLSREAAARIRALKQPQAGKDGEKLAPALPDCDGPLCAPGLHHPLCQQGWDADAERQAWEKDMVAAGAEDLGDGCWEWREDDFEFHLWQIAVRQRQRDTLLSVLGRLNSNPYNLMKYECVDLVREMFNKANAALHQAGLAKAAKNGGNHG